MRHADIQEGVEYAVNTYRREHPWRGQKREVLRARVEPREHWPEKRVLVYVVQQEVRRNDGRSGTMIIGEFFATVTPQSVLRSWAEEQAERERLEAAAEAQREQWKQEWAAEKEERKTKLAEWVGPFEGLMVNADTDTNSGVPRTLWDERKDDLDLARFLIEFWGEQESSTLTVREPLMQKIAARMAEYQRVIGKLELCLEFAGVHPNTIKALKDDGAT